MMSFANSATVTESERNHFFCRIQYWL